MASGKDKRPRETQPFYQPKPSRKHNPKPEETLTNSETDRVKMEKLILDLEESNRRREELEEKVKNLEDPSLTWDVNNVEGSPKSPHEVETSSALVDSQSKVYNDVVVLVEENPLHHEVPEPETWDVNNVEGSPESPHEVETSSAQSKSSQSKVNNDVVVVVEENPFHLEVPEPEIMVEVNDLLKKVKKLPFKDVILFLALMTIWMTMMNGVWQSTTNTEAEDLDIIEEIVNNQDTLAKIASGDFDI